MKLREFGPRLAIASSLTLAGCGVSAEANSPQEEAVIATFETQTSIGAIAIESTTSTTAETTIPEQSTTTEKRITTTVAPETTTTFSLQESENILPIEVYTEGTKIADLFVTNIDGEIVINTPLFVTTEINNKAKNDEQLSRGAILEIAHPDINPEMIGMEQGTPETGLIGDNGTAIIFGHRMTRVNPDWDGNPFNGYEGELQRVFERIDELEVGAILTLRLTEQAGGGEINYSLVGLNIIEDFELPAGGTLTQVAYDARSGPTDNQYIRLLACTPKGSSTDRIVAEFVIVD